MEDHPVWRNGTLTSAHRHAERQRIERKVARVAADVNAIGLDLGMRDGLRQHAIDHLRRMASLHPQERGWQWLADVAQRALAWEQRPRSAGQRQAPQVVRKTRWDGR